MTGRAVRGAGWTIATGIGARALGLVGTLAITYFLVPDVIGEVSDAAVLVLTASQLSTIGVGQYVIAKPDSGRDVAWHATVFHLALGALAIGFVALFRTHFGAWLHAPALAAYVPGLAVAAALERASFMPERLLARDMRFRVIGLSRTAAEITYSVASVGLAWAGFGGMGLVWGNVARSLVKLVLVAAAVDRREWLTPSRLSWKTTRELLSFGLPFSVSASAGFASRRWDNLLVSRMFGPGVLGQYNLAYNLADIPAVQVGEQIGDVLLPSFALMPLAQRKAALVRSTGLLALVVFPLAVGLGAVAPTAVHTLLRREWWSVAPMLVVLSALSVVRPIGWTIASYLTSRGLTKPLMWLGIFKVIFLLACIALLGRLGPLWACAGVGVAFAGDAFASMAVVSRKDGVRMRSMLASCAGPLVACAPLVAAVLAARAALEWAGVDVRGVGLATEIVAGAIGYVVGALLLARSTSKDFLDLVLRSRGKRRAASSLPPPPPPRTEVAEVGDVTLPAGS